MDEEDKKKKSKDDKKGKVWLFCIKKNLNLNFMTCEN